MLGTPGFPVRDPVYLGFYWSAFQPEAHYLGVASDCNCTGTYAVFPTQSGYRTLIEFQCREIPLK